MFARVATFEGVDVEAAKASSDELHDTLAPFFERMPGWMGAIQFAEPTTGKVFSVSIFSSAESAKASEEMFDEEMPKLLGDLMKGWSGKRVSVDDCEVILQLPRS